MSQPRGAAVPDRYEVRKAGPAEAPNLARTLAEAFHDDPLVEWVYPDESRRLEVVRRAFDLYLRRVWLDHEETYAVGDVAGVCVWSPPGEWELGIRRQLPLLPPMLRIYGRRLPRLLRTLTRFEQGHPTEPHYYLSFVGVAPASQGQGLGSILMHPVLRRCDAEGVPAYLEASTPRSRQLYERHGFAVTEEVRVGRDAPPVWRMWRQPR